MLGMQVLAVKLATFGTAIESPVDVTMKERAGLLAYWSLMPLASQAGCNAAMRLSAGLQGLVGEPASSSPMTPVKCGKSPVDSSLSHQAASGGCLPSPRQLTQQDCLPQFCLSRQQKQLCLIDIISAC